MRKILLIVLLISTSTTLFAQEKTVYPFKNSIKLSPFSFFKQNFIINYERSIGKSSGLVLSAGVYYNEDRYYNTLNSNDDYSIIGYLGELQYRNFYLIKQGKHNGWNRLFFSPYVFERQYQFNGRYNDLQFAPFETHKNTVNVYGGGVTMGYNLTVSKFSFEVYAGGGIRLFDDKASDIYLGSNSLFGSTHIYKGIVAKAGFNVGFAF